MVRRFAIVAVLLSAGLAVALPAALVTAQQPITVYFYSAESNVNNFSSLKTEFDRYLSGKGAFVFQPFSDRATFERTIAGKQNAVFLLSSWHYQILRGRVPMEPWLVGVTNNRTSRRRVLSARRNITQFRQLENTTVASAASDEYTHTLLRQMLDSPNARIEGLTRVLVVPKDIDALMALGFGMADAAVASEDGLAQLSRVNPKLSSGIHTLATSEPVMLPVVAVPAGALATVKDLLAVIEGMGQDPEGRKRLNMIGIDALKRLTESEIRTLHR